MKLKSKQSEERYASTGTVSNEPRVMVFPNVLDVLASDFLSFIDFNSSDMSSSTRIRARGISSFNFKGTALHSTKVSGMDSSMLRSRGSYGSPATDGTMLRGDGKCEFGLEIDHIAPIKDDGRKGIFDSDSKVGKEDAGSLNVGVDREAQEDHDCCKGNICACGVIAFGERGVEHSSTKNITKYGVNNSTSCAKDLCVAADLLESSIRVVAHE